MIAGPVLSPCSFHSSWSCAALRQGHPASRDQLTDQEQCEAATRITTRGKILSIDGPKTKRQKRSGFQGRQSGPPQFKNRCGHKRSQGVENNCSRRCKTMGTQWPSGMQNFCRVPAETIETCTIFAQVSSPQSLAPQVSSWGHSSSSAMAERANRGFALAACLCVVCIVCVSVCIVQVGLLLELGNVALGVGCCEPFLAVFSIFLTLLTCLLVSPFCCRALARLASPVCLSTVHAKNHMSNMCACMTLQVCNCGFRCVAAGLGPGPGHFKNTGAGVMMAP